MVFACIETDAFERDDKESDNETDKINITGNNRGIEEYLINLIDLISNEAPILEINKLGFGNWLGN